MNPHLRSYGLEGLLSSFVACFWLVPLKIARAESLEQLDSFDSSESLLLRGHAHTSFGEKMVASSRTRCCRTTRSQSNSNRRILSTIVYMASRNVRIAPLNINQFMNFYP